MKRDLAIEGPVDGLCPDGSGQLDVCVSSSWGDLGWAGQSDSGIVGRNV